MIDFVQVSLDFTLPYPAPELVLSWFIINMLLTTGLMFEGMVIQQRELQYEWTAWEHAKLLFLGSWILIPFIVWFKLTE